MSLKKQITQNVPANTEFINENCQKDYNFEVTLLYQLELKKNKKLEEEKQALIDHVKSLTTYDEENRINLLVAIKTKQKFLQLQAITKRAIYSLESGIKEFATFAKDVDEELSEKSKNYTLPLEKAYVNSKPEFSKLKFSPQLQQIPESPTFFVKNDSLSTINNFQNDVKGNNNAVNVNQNSLSLSPCFDSDRSISDDIIMTKNQRLLENLTHEPKKFHCFKKNLEQINENTNATPLPFSKTNFEKQECRLYNNNLDEEKNILDSVFPSETSNDSINIKNTNFMKQRLEIEAYEMSTNTMPSPSFITISGSSKKMRPIHTSTPKEQLNKLNLITENIVLPNVITKTALNSNNADKLKKTKNSEKPPMPPLQPSESTLLKHSNCSQFQQNDQKRRYFRARKKQIDPTIESEYTSNNQQHTRNSLNAVSLLVRKIVSRNFSV